jgi:hypothetical protein
VPETYSEPWKRDRKGGAYHAWRVLSHHLVGEAGAEPLADRDALVGHLERDVARLVGASDDEIAAWKEGFDSIARIASSIGFLLTKLSWKYWLS